MRINNGVTVPSLYSVVKVQVAGDKEIRTLDPLLAGQVLSQLSYAPGVVHLLTASRC